MIREELYKLIDVLKDKRLDYMAHNVKIPNAVFMNKQPDKTMKLTSIWGINVYIDPTLKDNEFRFEVLEKIKDQHKQ